MNLTLTRHLVNQIVQLALLLVLGDLILLWVGIIVLLQFVSVEGNFIRSLINAIILAQASNMGTQSTVCEEASHKGASLLGRRRCGLECSDKYIHLRQFGWKL